MVICCHQLNVFVMSSDAMSASIGSIAVSCEETDRCS